MLRGFMDGLAGVLRTGALSLLVLAVASCDFEVTNPGPIHDVNLDDQGAHDATVNGAMRGVLRALSEYALYGGAISRDFVAASHTGWAGISMRLELGQMDKNLTNSSGWSNAHSGRWIGEHMAERLRETMGAEAESYQPLGRFLLWAGLANRVLGEHACSALFEDSTEPEHWTVFFERAVATFEDAEQVASAAGDEEARLAAIGGAASAHLYLGNWDRAYQEASRVPRDFVFQGEYTSSHPDWFWPHDSNTTGFRSLTFWGHPFETYFPETGDPRAAWGFDDDVWPDVARPTWGEILPFYYSLKLYAPRHKPTELENFQASSTQQHELPVNLVSGREMLLVRAEALLAGQGDWQGAMELINEVRTTAFDRGTGEVGSYFTGEPLEPVTASSLEEAWTALRFERLVELSVEGRRFGDRKRWAHYDSPGQLDRRELLPDFFVETHGVPREPNVCFPMSQTEIDRNPILPVDFQEEVISG